MKKLLLLAFIFLYVQVQAQCWKQLDGGNGYMAGITLDGALWGWGNNFEGQLGNGSFDQNNVPVTRIGTDNNWQSVATGTAHTMAIKTDGTLWGTGRNLWGQLGIGTNESISTLIQIGTDTDWVSVYCKVNITFAIKANGTLWACGNNFFGELGDGTTVNKNVFVQIGNDTNWKMVIPGWEHSIGVKTDGTLWTWGYNDDGQLGNGQTGSEFSVSSPVQVGTSTDWSYANAGADSSFGLKNDGTLWSWGAWGSGELGHVIDGPTNIPVKISNDVWNTFDITNSTVIAIKNDGTLWGWGDNYNGLVGDGTNTDRHVPVLLDNNTNWQSAVTGYTSNFAIKSDNYIWGWGSGYANVLMPASSITVNHPVFVDNCPTAGLNKNVSLEMKLYPNPVTNTLHIKIPGNTGIDSVIITDITGKTVLQQNYTTEINVQHFPTGVYFLKILSKGTTQNIKFIKQW